MVGMARWAVPGWLAQPGQPAFADQRRVNQVRLRLVTGNGEWSPAEDAEVAEWNGIGTQSGNAQSFFICQPVQKNTIAGRT